MSIVDYRSVADNVLYEEIYRRAKLANQTLVINPREILPPQELSGFHSISRGVLATTTPISPNPLSEPLNAESDLSDSRIAIRIREQLLQKVKDYINRLDYVISYSFTYQDQAIFVILYTDKMHRLSQLLKDWPLDSLNIENHSVKFLPKDYELLPEFGREEKESRNTGPDHDTIWPALQEAQNTLFQQHRNVVGITGGYFKDQEVLTPCLKIYVHSKGYIPLGETSIPRRILDVQTKICEGRYHNLSGKASVTMNYANPAGDYHYADPIKPGVSIGILNKPYVGTLGGVLVNPTSPDQRYLLTNRHVAIDVCDPDLHSIIVQPSGTDYKREIWNRLSDEQKSEEEKQQALKDLDLARCVIGNVRIESWKSVSFQTKNLGPIMVGIDAAIVELKTQRQISAQMEFRDPDYALLETVGHSGIFELGSELDEDVDLIYKRGRTTGVTIGAPQRLPAGICNRGLGEYEIEKKATAGSTSFTFSHNRDPSCINPEEHRHSPVPLLNQYLIVHKVMKPVFAQAGDSGALCYLRRASDPQLYPWGLLNGTLESKSYSYGIASPIDAVMKCVAPGMVLMGEKM